MRIVLFIIIFLGACSTSNLKPKGELFVGGMEKAEKYAGLLWYHIAIEDEMKVTLRLHSPPSHLRFFIPMEWGGRSDLAERIHINGAIGPRGPVALTIDRVQGIVEIDARDCDWVQLNYSVDLNPGDRVFAQVEHGNIFAFVPAFLIRPSANILDQLVDIPVEIVTPKRWNLFSTWPLVDSKISKNDETKKLWSYLIEDPNQLVDAFITTGPDLVENNIGHVSVIIHADQKKNSETISHLVSKLVGYYEKKFGEIGEVIVVIRPRHGRKNEYFGMGRKGGFVLELDDISELSDEAKILIAHEALHLWNGHSIHSSNKEIDETRWFKEGLTEYLALKSLYLLGDLSKHTFLDQLAFAASSYWTNPAREFNGNQRFGSEGDTEVLSYDRGLLIALALDGMMVKSGSKSVENWLEILLLTAESRTPGYSSLLLYKTLSPYVDNTHLLRVFWSSQVVGKDALDLRGIFSSVDLHYLPARSKTPAKIVEIEKEDSIFKTLYLH